MNFQILWGPPLASRDGAERLVEALRSRAPPAHTAPRTCHSQNRVVSVFPNLLRPGTRAFLKSPSILLQIPLKSPPNPLEIPLKPPYVPQNFKKPAIISLQNKPLFECRNSTALSRGFQGKSSHFFRHPATVVAHKYDIFFTPRTPLGGSPNYKNKHVSTHG